MSLIQDLKAKPEDNLYSLSKAMELAEVCIASSYKAKHCDPMIDFKDNVTKKVDTEEGEPENYD